MNPYRYASPQAFFPLAGRLLPWFVAAAVLLMAAGMVIGFLVAPADFQQGEVYRIIFIHVPAAWMAMLVYLVMAAIEVPPVGLTLAPWCRVFHHCTEK